MAEEVCYLTTTGRRTGKPHTIEIWFGREGDTLYLLAGGGEQADWVRNGRAEPDVTVRIGDDEHAARFRVVEDREEDALARRLLLEKYFGGSTNEWGRIALAAALDLRPTP
jgi:deazaflavin-dependent oxidoreductase (nitroreductase family)